MSTIISPQVGLLKNEVPNDDINRFVGVRSKTYALLTKSNVLETRAKGVKRATKATLTFEQYAKCVQAISKVSRDDIVTGEHRPTFLHYRST